MLAYKFCAVTHLYLLTSSLVPHVHIPQGMSQMQQFVPVSLTNFKEAFQRFVSMERGTYSIAGGVIFNLLLPFFHTHAAQMNHAMEIS